MERPTGYQVGMTTRYSLSSDGSRFPSEILDDAAWLYFRFPLTLRMPACGGTRAFVIPPP